MNIQLDIEADSENLSLFFLRLARIVGGNDIKSANIKASPDEIVGFYILNSHDDADQFEKGARTDPDAQVKRVTPVAVEVKTKP